MQVDDSLVTYIATTYYNLSPILGSIKPLCGYSDKNFSLTDAGDHKTYVLKIVNKDESDAKLAALIDEVLDNASAYGCANSPVSSSLLQETHFVVPKLIRTTGDKLSTFTSVLYEKQTLGGAKDEDETQTRQQSTNRCDNFQVDPSFATQRVKCNIKLFAHFDGVTMFDYVNSHNPSLIFRSSPSGRQSGNLLQGEKLYRLLGRVCNELFVFLRTQRHLIEELKQARGDSFPWQLTTCEPHLRQVLDRIYPDKKHTRRILIEQVIDEYKHKIKPQLDQLPEFILHGDLCNKNILLNWDSNSPFKNKLCLVDFQDLQVGQQVVDLSILMLYSVLEQEQMDFVLALKQIPQWIFAGYQSNTPTSARLESGQLQFAPVVMKLRLCQSLLNGQLAFQENPSNSYVLHTNQRGWQLLELMSNEQLEFGDANKLAHCWLNEPERPQTS